MAFNGSGTYSLPAGNPVITGTTISSTVQNNTMSDIATALTDCVTRDGQSPLTANLPMGGFKALNQGAGTALTDGATLYNVKNGSGQWGGTAGGTANALTINTSPLTTAYAIGQKFRCKSGASNNSGATTIAVDGLPPIAVQINGAACVGGEIQANAFYEVFFDTATTCQLTSMASVSAAYMAASGTALNATNATNLTGIGNAAAFDARYAPISVFSRSLLAGCTMSTAGASTTMSIAAGVAADSTNAVLMSLAAIAKTTSAWAVGTAQGGLDTGTIANSTWYHFYAIRRPDTGVVDVVFSTNATSPTLPTNYTQYRRIGSAKTNGSAQWIKFFQDGDYFQWDVAVTDINITNPGTAAVTRTLSTPLGVRVEASFNLQSGVGATGTQLLVTDLSTTDTAPTATLFTITHPVASTGFPALCRIYTNTSSQIRTRNSASDANVSIIINTLGWTDSRGRNA